MGRWLRRPACGNDGRRIVRHALYSLEPQSSPLGGGYFQRLENWTKHGLAFAKAYNGRFANIASKSASIVTGVKDGRLVIEKVAGKYFMYWGENAVCAATSDNLTDWAPVLNENNELKGDSQTPQRVFRQPPD